MANLSEEANAYEPPKTKNISDLAEVNVDTEVKTKVATKKTGEEFTYKYIEVAGEEYRVANIILGQLKEQLAANPGLKKFKVSKTGEGLKTIYTVIPLV